ncbi:methylmalonyl Co-A mutase-associated GTPase MeaB [bacterium]|nr:methylmalonyl Co-A mutase-associated GTPase MeaB [bacterium]
MSLARNIIQGDIRAIARAMTWIENEHEAKEQLIDEIFPDCGRATVWGITGPPGAGKSTLTDQLITRERRQGRKVGIIAVDPSSPFSGGAILGDRLRMQQHATDDGVFIRSMASRGHLGGVAGSTGDAVKVLDAAGFDTIIVETIGVGQTEIEVMGMADIVLLVLVPGLGDEIQALKAGVMEIGDLFVINKADRDDAGKIKAEVEYVLGLKYAENMAAKNPVLMVSALTGQGIDDLHHSLYSYLNLIRSSGTLEQRRRDRLAGELRTIAAAKIEALVHYHLDFEDRLDSWVEMLYSRKESPYGLMNGRIESLIKELTDK